MDQHPPPDHQYSIDSALAYEDADTDINIVTGVTGLSQNHRSFNDQGSNPLIAQSGVHVQSPGEPSHEGGHARELGLAKDFQNTAIHPTIEERLSDNGWGATPLENTREQATPQHHAGLFQSQQLSSAFKNIYY